MIELADIVNVIWKGRRVILIATLLCALIPYGGSFLIPNYFRAYTQILLNPEGLRIFEFDLQKPDQAVAYDAHVANQLEMIVSRPVLAQFVRQEGLHDDPNFGASPNFPELEQRTSLAVDRLQKRLSVKQIETSHIIELATIDHHPERASRIANEIVGIFLKRNQQLSAESFTRLSDDLTAKLDQQRLVVEAADRAVNEYRTRHNLAILDGEPDTTRQVATLTRQISDASAEIALAETLMSQLDAARANTGARLTLPEAASTPSLIRLNTRHNQSREELQVISAQVGVRHPDYQSAAERMQTIKALLDDELGDHIEASRQNIQTVRTEQNLLNDQLDRLKARLNATDKTMIDLRELERDLDAKRLVYEALLLRTRQLSEQAGTTQNQPKITSAAVVPLQKAGPPRLTMGILGGVSGLILSMAVLLLRGDLLTTSARRGLAA